MGLLKSLIARLRVRAFKYIVKNNYGLCGSNYSWEGTSGASDLLRERESKTDNAVFGSEWQGARAANVMRVPAGMFSLVTDSGMVLFMSGASNLINTMYSRWSFLHKFHFGWAVRWSHWQRDSNELIEFSPNQPDVRPEWIFSLVSLKHGLPWLRTNRHNFLHDVQKVHYFCFCVVGYTRSTPYPDYCHSNLIIWERLLGWHVCINNDIAAKLVQGY